MTDETVKEATDTINTRDELNGIKQIAEALANKSPEQKMRMLKWAADKFCGCTLAYKPETKGKPL